MGNSVIMCEVESYRPMDATCAYLSLTTSPFTRVSTMEVQQRDRQNVAQWQFMICWYMHSSTGMNSRRGRYMMEMKRRIYGSEDKRTEVEETQTDEVYQFLALQSDELEKQMNVLRIYKQVVSQERPSGDEVPERNDTGYVACANDLSNDSAEFYKIHSTREQRVDEVQEPTVLEHVGPRLHDLAQQHAVEHPAGLGVDHQDPCDKNDVEHGMREVEKPIQYVVLLTWLMIVSLRLSFTIQTAID